MNQELRTQYQEEAFQTVYGKKRLLLEWGTGVGKSRVGIRLAKALCDEERGKILLLVAETPHKKNWKAEFIEALGQDEGERVYGSLTVECYASLKKYSGSRWDAVIADEAHHLRSAKRLDILSTLSTEWFLALSATISDRGDGETLLSTLGFTFGPFEDLKYTLDDAIDEGLLPEPVIDVRAVEMSEHMADRYDKMNQYVQDCKDRYYKEREDRGFRPGDPDNAFTQDFKDKWMHAGSLRKQLLGQAKTWEAKKLIATLGREGKRIIVFCASIKQIEMLGGRNIINSKRRKKDNEQTISAFNSHEIDSLYVVGMLQEGQNLKDIDAGIIIQMDGKERSFIQRFGRVMRSSKPYLYIIYVPGTRDEEYLGNALQDRNPDHIKGWTMPINESETAQIQQENIFPEWCSTQETAVENKEPAGEEPFTVKDLSRETLTGPWLSPNTLEQRYDLVVLKDSPAGFNAYKRGTFVRRTRQVAGQFYGVSVNPLTEEVNVYLRTPNQLLDVVFDFERSIETLSRVAGSGVLYHETLSLCKTSDAYGRDGMAVYGYRNGQSLLQGKVERMPESREESLNLVNNLVEYITSRFKREKEAAR